MLHNILRCSNIECIVYIQFKLFFLTFELVLGILLKTGVKTFSSSKLLKEQKKKRKPKKLSILSSILYTIMYHWMRNVNWGNSNHDYINCIVIVSLWFDIFLIKISYLKFYYYFMID